MSAERIKELESQLQEAHDCIRKLIAIYADVDENGEPNAPVLEIIAAWERAMDTVVNTDKF